MRWVAAFTRGGSREGCGKGGAVAVPRLCRLFVRGPGIAASDQGYPHNSVFFTLGKSGFSNGRCTRGTLTSNYICTMVSGPSCFVKRHAVLISGILAALRRLTRHRHGIVNYPVVNVAKAGKGAAAGRLLTSILSAGCGLLCARNGLGGRVNMPLALLHLARSRRVTIVRVKTDRPNSVGRLISVTRPGCKVVAGIKHTRLRNFNSFRNIVGAGNRLCSCVHHAGNGVFVGRSGGCLGRVTGKVRRIACNSSRATFT